MQIRAPRQYANNPCQCKESTPSRCRPLSASDLVPHVAVTVRASMRHASPGRYAIGLLLVCSVDKRGADVGVLARLTYKFVQAAADGWLGTCEHGAVTCVREAASRETVTCGQHNRARARALQTQALASSRSPLVTPAAQSAFQLSHLFMPVFT